jgi:hypothetical protein
MAFVGLSKKMTAINVIKYLSLNFSNKQTTSDVLMSLENMITQSKDEQTVVLLLFILIYICYL